MANDCLVTKLKGTVQNDSLREFNTLKFTLQSVDFVDMATSARGPVHVHTDGSTIGTTPGYDKDMSANTTSATRWGINDKSVVTTFRCKDMYNLGGIDLKGAVFVDDSVNAFIKYAPELEALGNIKASDVDWRNINMNKLIYLTMSFDSEQQVIENKSDIASLIENKEFLKIQVMVGNVITGNLADITINDNVRYCEIARNTIDSIPSKAELASLHSVGTTGALEDFVARAKAAGRTTGECQLMNGRNCTWATFNGTPLATYVSEHSITNNVKLTWDADTISVVDTGTLLYSEPSVWTYRQYLNQ